MTNTKKTHKIPPTYWYTGKRGTNNATGAHVRELENAKQQRLWIADDGTISDE